MKEIKIRWFEYLSNEPEIRTVEVSKFFEANGRKFAVCKTHSKRKYWGIYDCLTGVEMPNFVTGNVPTIKGKVNDTIQYFNGEHKDKAEWHQFPIINPEFAI